MLENPREQDPKVPPPMAVNTCFDRLEVRINRALLDSMELHLVDSGEGGDNGEDTDFDRWIHGQIYQSDYNAL